MGNYGSAHNLRLENTNTEMITNYYRNRQQPQKNSNRYQKRTCRDETSHSDWTNSLPSALTNKSGKEQLSPYKMLPTDMKHGLKLRTTTNGEILQSGGTISGKKFHNFQATENNTNRSFRHECNHNESIPIFRRAHTMLELNCKNSMETIQYDEHKCPRSRNTADFGQEGNTSLLDEDYRRSERIAEQETPEGFNGKKSVKMLKFNKKRKAPAAPCLSTPTTLAFNKTNKKSTITSVVRSDQQKHQCELVTSEGGLNEACTRTNRTSRSDRTDSGHQQIHHNDSTNLLRNLPYRREKSFDQLLIRPISDKFSSSDSKEYKREYMKDAVALNSIIPPQIEDKLPNMKSTFYFGMSSMQKPSEKKPTDEAMTDQFKLQQDVDISSYKLMASQTIDHGTDELQKVTGDKGILVHVRPTLPRRQLEIPSFSPFAAWRLLQDEKECLRRRGIFNCTEKTNTIIGSDTAKSATRNPCKQQVHILNNEENRRKTLTKSWTPQQDLEDDDEDDIKFGAKEINDAKQSPRSKALVQTEPKQSPTFSTKGHVFHLSLPRERQILCSQLKNKPFNTENFKELQKQRGHNGSSTMINTSAVAVYDSNNWVLHNSTKTQLYPNEKPIMHFESKKSFEQVLLTYFKPGKHFIYLPEDEEPKSVGDPAFKSPITGDASPKHHQSEVIATSTVCSSDLQEQRVNQHQRKKNGRESLQDDFPSSNHTSQWQPDESHLTELQRKLYTSYNRFSIHSTIRNLEKKRLAQKLIKEAEIRESQRKTELEAMKLVEEDFQRKRAHEKADIREKMKVYLNDIAFEHGEQYELPRQGYDKNNNTILQRAEPEGADCPMISM